MGKLTKTNGRYSIRGIGTGLFETGWIFAGRLHDQRHTAGFDGRILCAKTDHSTKQTGFVVYKWMGRKSTNCRFSVPYDFRLS